MKDLRILFVNVCLRRGSPVKILPVGLASVMTFIKAQGYSFDLLDIDINDYEDDVVEEKIKNSPYDVILLGSIVTHYKWVKWFTKMVKGHHPNTKLIIGNSVGASCYQAFMENTPTDVLVVGEGEFSCLETLNAFRNGTSLDGIHGIVFRGADGRAVKNPPRKASDIDVLPMVEWDFFDVKRYISRSENMSFGGLDPNVKPVSFPVTTARGCVFKCTFCHYVYWDDPYRKRSVAQVIAEIRRNMEKYGANYIAFWDDLSFSSLTQVEKMADAILASGLKFNWDAAVRVDLFGNPQIAYERRLTIARKMKAAGCVAAGFSLESGDEEILTLMNKKIKAEYFTEQIRVLREAGIASNTSVVFGYPIETKETIKKTFDMCLESKVYPSIGFLLPLPYTGMYEYARKNGFIPDEDAFLTSITERQDICINMTRLSDDEIMNEIKEGAKNLNRLLELGLDEQKLVRTGGYAKHTKKSKKAKKPLDPDDMKRNVNDFSFNYSDTIFVKDQTGNEIFKGDAEAPPSDAR
ncbi:MAG: B12-binding domain-containing radical SAM protein [Elusimicrobia bacterium]|nr:B12-binding domain-containing radical SAM protein [Elusimicrobiota bacterium]